MVIYKRVHQAILNYVEQLELPLGTSNNDVYMAIRQIMRDNPDIFWFSHIWRSEEHTSELQSQR